MEQPTISRRHLLASVPAVAAVATVAPSSFAQPANGLDATIAAYHRAVAEAKAFHDAVYGPAHDTWRRLAAAIPHHTSPYSFKGLDGKELIYSTENEVAVRMARAVLRDLKPHQNDDFALCCRDLVEADDRRQVEAQRIKGEYRIDELEERYNQLLDASGEALEAVEAFPVRTVAELLRKSELIEDTGGEHLTLLDDLRRIGGRAH